MQTTKFAVLSLIINCSVEDEYDRCSDILMSCANWVAEEPQKCSNYDRQMLDQCPKACQQCGEKVPREYDLRRVPENLRPIAFLIGKWRSEHGGKAFFPTIPKFTYGEEIDIKLSSENMTGLDTLNYTAFAWDNNDMVELHSESGFITVQNGSRNVSLTTVMSNGFMTVEEGYEKGNAIRLFSNRIARIHFSRDLPVYSTIRDWMLLEPNRMEQRFSMSTQTHNLMEHTSIIYRRIAP